MPGISPLTSRYDPFLYAPLFEKNGVPVSLLSVLTRLDIDPWEEAARLETLSRDGAANSLASTIWKASSDCLSASEASILAVRLIELLPRADDQASPYPALTNHGGQFLMWLMYGIVWGSLVLSGANSQQSKSDVGDVAHNLTLAERTISPPVAPMPHDESDRR